LFIFESGKMKLECRETKEVLNDNFQYSELSETWKFEGNNANRFYYYRLSVPLHQFISELVSISLFPEEGSVFDCSGPPLWVARISPIRLVQYGERSSVRIYGSQSLVRETDFYMHHERRGQINDYLSALCKIYPNNEESTPQAALERIVGVHKPDLWSWEKIIDLVYENITKARNALLNYAKEVPNEDVARVIGDLEFRKPTSQECITVNEDLKKKLRDC